MLRVALLLMLAPATLGACNSLPDRAKDRAQSRGEAAWPRLLTTAELEAALPPENAPVRPVAPRSAEAELTDRGAGLRARAEALRRRSIE